tara:strand:+ start:213 stop:476 length:264 start_codon:yes stop_codon:yes gene_type:complete
MGVMKRIHGEMITNPSFNGRSKDKEIKAMHDIYSLACTTEDASQTVRGGEQPNENGLVQSPDNAETSGDAETNDNPEFLLRRIRCSN